MCSTILACFVSRLKYFGITFDYELQVLASKQTGLQFCVNCEIKHEQMKPERLEGQHWRRPPSPVVQKKPKVIFSKSDLRAPLAS